LFGLFCNFAVNETFMIHYLIALAAKSPSIDAAVKTRNRLIYKGECQEKYFSLDRKWREFS
jgi:hypothetical protein